MSFNLVEAFKKTLSFQSQAATLTRRGEVTAIDIMIAPSNYFRDFSSIEEIPVSGNEFVIETSQLVGTGFSAGIKRGDVIVNAIYGTMTVEEIRPMTILGSLAAYRVRVNK